MLFASLIALASILIDGSPCPECRVDPRRTLLCATHLDEEATSLREERSIMARSKDRDERIAALERVAALTQSHTNAPSPNVARFLADGLHDDSLTVRRRALALLLDGQHHDETVKGVIDGWRATQRAWKELDAQLSTSLGEGAKGASTMTRQELEELPHYMVASIAALGAVQDERAYRDVLNVFKWPTEHTPGRFYVAAARAALSLESRKGVETVLEFCLQAEADLLDAKLAPRFGPSGGLLSALMRPLDNVEATDIEEMLDLLAAFARHRKCPETPAKALNSAAEWRVWFKESRDRFAERPTPFE